MTHDLVEVAAYNLLPNAEVVRLGLETEGVTVFLYNAEVVNMDWLYANAVGNIRLMVPRDQAEQAASILERFSSREEQHVCPVCESAIREGETNCPACHWPHAFESDPAVDEPSSDAFLPGQPDLDSWPSRLAWLRALRTPALLFLLLDYGLPVAILLLFTLLSLLGFF